MQRKKILFVITKGNWGGAQKYVYEMAANLPMATYDIKVLYGAGSILPERLKARSIPCMQIPELGRDIKVAADFSSFRKLITIFKTEKPDIVHLNSSKIGGLGAFAARIAGVKKIVFTVHGFAFNEERPSWEKALIAFLSWLTIILSTDTICISKREHDQAASWLFTSRKLRFIRNGIAMPKFLDKTQARLELGAILKRPDLGYRTILVGTIAELTNNKGLIYGIEAIRAVPNIHYVIIGKGEEAQRLASFIGDSGLSSRVSLTGFVEDASRFLKAFDIFLLPSIKEGLPYVLIEAGAAGLPAIASNVGGIPEIIEDKVSGLVIEAKDIKAFTKALEELATRPELREKYGKNLRQAVEKNFTLGKMIAETEKVYG